jgi:hypothetical protein
MLPHATVPASLVKWTVMDQHALLRIKGHVRYLILWQSAEQAAALRCTILQKVVGNLARCDGRSAIDCLHQAGFPRTVRPDDGPLLVAQDFPAYVPKHFSARTPKGYLIQGDERFCAVVGRCRVVHSLETTPTLWRGLLCPMIRSQRTNRSACLPHLGLPHLTQFSI